MGQPFDVLWHTDHENWLNGFGKAFFWHKICEIAVKIWFNQTNESTKDLRFMKGLEFQCLQQLKTTDYLTEHYCRHTSIVWLPHFFTFCLCRNILICKNKTHAFSPKAASKRRMRCHTWKLASCIRRCNNERDTNSHSAQTRHENPRWQNRIQYVRSVFWKWH